MKHCQTLFLKKHSHKKEKNEQLKKKTNVQPKDNTQKCKYINGAYNKKIWEVISWGKWTTSHLSNEVYFLKNGREKTCGIKKNLFDNNFFVSKWKPFEFSIKSLTPFAYKLNVKQQKGPLKHLVDHTIFYLHISQKNY